mmetsp:Transcript_23026/g.54361  ORF Transcript_23026/g.54361 Transcript_23026/m.54361 type:complete len:973 (+) Transcript_23026:86-3004(+)
MDDDASTSPPRDTDNRSGQGARLLQVTMAGVDPEEKELIGGDGSIEAAVTAASASAAFPSSSEDFVLQSPIPETEVTDDRKFEMRIDQDRQKLDEIDRKRVDFDLRSGGIQSKASVSSVARTTEGSGSSILPPPSVDMEALKMQTESLGQELTRLLGDSEEQKKNPLYKTIGEVLTSADSNFYANSFGFRTKLLRAEHFDVEKAAKRTADYLTLLWESFGKEILGRPIQLSDLTTAERQLQRKGYQQLFRFRDQSKPKQSNRSSGSSTNNSQDQSQEQYQQQNRINTEAGRRIAGSFDLCRCTNTSEPAIENEISKLRVLMYLMQVASDDEETQKQGIVFIFMLALRGVLGESESLTESSSSGEIASTRIISSSSSSSKSLGTSESTPAPSGKSSSSTSTLQRIDSDNIFANDSASESDQHHEEQQDKSLHFSPHEKSHRHKHTMTRVRKLSKVFRCGPVRIAAIHICSPNRPELYNIRMDLLEALHPLERARTRFHNGTSMECSLSLNKMGIPTDRLPLKYDGTIKTEDHLQWIAIQEAKESALKQNRSFKIVECPMNMDILSGRGQLVRSHPGNVSFRKDFIRARSTRYDMAGNREQKNAIANEILEDISNLRRRFLKQHQGAGYWTELDPKTAKEKVMMAFREFRKSQRSQQQQLQKKHRLQQQNHPPAHPAHASRASLALSQAPSQSEARRPSLSMSMPKKDHFSHHSHHRGSSPAPLQQPTQDREQLQTVQEHHPMDSRISQQQQEHDFHYQPYSAVINGSAAPATVDDGGMTRSASGSMLYHSQDQIAAFPHQQITPTLSYYPPPHPNILPHLHHPYGYPSHPIPSHLSATHPHHFPPPHLPHPLHLPHPQETPPAPTASDRNEDNTPPTDNTTGERNRLEAATAMGYMSGSAVPPPPIAYHQHHHISHLSAISMELEPHHASLQQHQSHQQHQSQPQSHTGIGGIPRGHSDDAGDHRSYKRFRTL